jgi:hypothetical protein
MKKEVLISLVCLSFIFFIAGGIFLQKPDVDKNIEKNTAPSQGLQLKGFTQYEIKRKDGSHFISELKPNLITNIGLNHTIDMLAGLNTQTGQSVDFDVKYMEVESNGAVSKTDVNCAGVAIGGITRGTGSVVYNGTTGCFRVSFKWVASDVHTNITHGCVYYNATGDTLFMAGEFSPYAYLGAGDEFTYNHTLCVS